MTVLLDIEPDAEGRRWAYALALQAIDGYTHSRPADVYRWSRRGRQRDALWARGSVARNRRATPQANSARLNTVACGPLRVEDDAITRVRI